MNASLQVLAFVSVKDMVSIMLRQI